MDKKDLCVLCGAQTPYTFNTSIYQRIGYIEGAGQGCYIKPFSTNNKVEECPEGKNNRNKQIHLK
jgi:hypothetical protein